MSHLPTRAKEAFAKAAAFCAYQERSRMEVRRKLNKFDLSEDEVELVIEELEAEGFLSDTRFAKLFAGSKFRQKKWGRIKIAHALREKYVSEADISKGLLEIEEEDYRLALDEALKSKLAALPPGEAPLKRRQKAANFALQRGFESDLVYTALNRLL